MPRTERPLIALLVAPETSSSVLYGLYDVLVSVGAVYLDMTTGSPGRELLDVRIVTAEGKPFHCVANVPVSPHASIEDIDVPDAIVVCDMYTSIHASPIGRYPREIAWLSRMHERGTLISSVCSGSLLLAEAGLLDGRAATAHWAYRDMFQRHFPKVRFQSESMLCLASADDGVLTAGGVSAWHDLAVFLITRFCGPTQAIETAKVFLISGHSEGQSPYAVMTRPMESNDGPITDSQEWIADHYAAANPVEKMVERSGLNPRTFSRRFRTATGFAPIEYVQALRVEEAKQMLEMDQMSNDDVGAAIGYDDPASFRRVFKRSTGMTPAAYRKKFQRIARIAQPA